MKQQDESKYKSTVQFPLFFLLHAVQGSSNTVRIHPEQMAGKSLKHQ